MTADPEPRPAREGRNPLWRGDEDRAESPARSPYAIPEDVDQEAVRAHFIADVALATRTALLRYAGQLPVPPAPQLPRHLQPIQRRAREEFGLGR